MRRIRRLLPIQVLSVLSRRTRRISSSLADGHDGSTDLGRIIKHGLELFHPFSRPRNPECSRDLGGRILEVQTAFGHDHRDVPVTTRSDHHGSSAFMPTSLRLSIHAGPGLTPRYTTRHPPWPSRSARSHTPNSSQAAGQTRPPPAERSPRYTLPPRSPSSSWPNSL